MRAIAALGPVHVWGPARGTSLYRLAGGFAEVTDFAGGAFSLAGVRQARAIGAQTPRRVVVFPRSFSSAVRAAVVGARERIGIDDEARGLLLTRRVALPWAARSRHLAEEFARIAEAAGAVRPDDAPRLSLDAAHRRRAAALLAARGASLEARPLVAVCPGAAFGPAKRWAAERFADVAARARGAGADVALLGADADRDATAAVARALSRADAPACGAAALDLTGATDLPLLAALLALARVALVNDSGPMHLAAAVGTPVVALFGSTSPDWTAPLGAGHTVIRYPVPCSPCFRRDCPIGLLCFEGIDADRVWEEVARRIDGGRAA
jgi:heptosyltransferase-2